MKEKTADIIFWFPNPLPESAVPLRPVQDHDSCVHTGIPDRKVRSVRPPTAGPLRTRKPDRGDAGIRTHRHMFLPFRKCSAV